MIAQPCHATKRVSKLEMVLDPQATAHARDELIEAVTEECAKHGLGVPQARHLHWTRIDVPLTGDVQFQMTAAPSAGSTPMIVGGSNDGAQIGVARDTNGWRILRQLKLVGAGDTREVYELKGIDTATWRWRYELTETIYPELTTTEDTE